LEAYATLACRVVAVGSQISQINKMSIALGRVWNQELFDYIVRSPAQLARFEEYIGKNPNSLPFGKRATKNESIRIPLTPGPYGNSAGFICWLP